MIYCKYWLSGHSILDPRAYASVSARKELASLPGCHAQKSSGVEIAATGKVLTFTDMVQCEVNLQMGRILLAKIWHTNVIRVNCHMMKFWKIPISNLCKCGVYSLWTGSLFGVCLGKNSEEREGKGGERALFAFPSPHPVRLKACSQAMECNAVTP